MTGRERLAVAGAWGILWLVFSMPGDIILALVGAGFGCILG